MKDRKRDPWISFDDFLKLASNSRISWAGYVHLDMLWAGFLGKNSPNATEKSAGSGTGRV